ncbi:MAG: class I SAM-dependent methyltransferase [Planctomycetaceae bacterium]|nr:class I SAM-dependent methyltransferase [Planctomycetaceae bacterium]
MNQPGGRQRAAVAQSPQFESRCSQARCRSCGHAGLDGILDLGAMPLADGLLTGEQLGQAEARYPLELAFCPDCTLVQIVETVPPEVLFGADYPYFSSFSAALLEHSRDNALNLIAQRRLNAHSLVVEIASNDGYLLKNFLERQIPVLGIDPAAGPVRAAREIGVPTLQEFFSLDLARRLTDEGKRADVIIANNVLAHVADTNGIVAGMAVLLKDGGVVVIEVPYLRELIDHCEFDTIYHEHLCYFSVTAVDRLARRHGLYLNRVQQLPIHGGSLRLFLELKDRRRSSVTEMLAAEAALGMDRVDYYRTFARRVAALQHRLRRLLGRLQSQGRSIAAYGAAAKGAIMLNSARVGQDIIRYVVDRNVHKQGKYMPGVHIPIDAPQRIMEDKPDYVLVLPWNFKDEILRQCQEYRDQGGRFIIPVPRPVVV